MRLNHRADLALLILVFFRPEVGTMPCLLILLWPAISFLRGYAAFENRPRQ